MFRSSLEMFCKNSMFFTCSRRKHILRSFLTFDTKGKMMFSLLNCLISLGFRWKLSSLFPIPASMVMFDLKCVHLFELSVSLNPNWEQHKSYHWQNC